MIINLLKTDGYKFAVDSKNHSCQLDAQSSVFEMTDKTFTIKQVSVPSPAGASQWIVYFLKMFLSTVARAFIVLRKKIKQEESPIFLEAEIELLKDYEDSGMYFEKSEFSPFDHLLTKPHFTLDPAIRLKSVKYFVDMPTVITNKRKQILRSLSNYAMLFFLDSIFLVYTIIEEIPVASTLSVFLFLPIIAGLIISMILRAKKYKVYMRELNSEVTYLNAHSKERGSDAGIRV